MISSPFSPNGRVRRSHFFIALVALNGIGKALDLAVEQPSSSPLLLVFYVLLAWPGVTLMVQRAHDAGRDGKFVAIALTLMLGSVVAFVFGSGVMDNGVEGTSMFSFFAALILGSVFLLGFVMTWIVYLAPGDPKPNKYGSNPRLREPSPTYAGAPGAPEDALIDLAGRRGFDTGE